MKNMIPMKKFLLSSLIVPGICLSSPSEEKIQSLYSGLDPYAIPQQLALYELYPDSVQGKQALQNAWRLLSQSDTPPDDTVINALLGKGEIKGFVDFLLSMRSDKEYLLSVDELKTINALSETLSNRKLKGFHASTEEEVLALPPHEVDVSQALLLSLFGDKPESRKQMLQFNAMLDVMALQIRARLTPDSNAISKVHAISQFVFHEMRFRFPPESLYAKSIDFYTFLPSVLQSRRGVCLGVSTLYLCLAQRLDLDLEIITPPGHIYLRHRDGDNVINIETTARGIHLPSEKYLSINTRKLQIRNAKEVVGMNYFNQAAIFWQHKEHEKAIEAYEKALLYTPEDPLTMELLAYNYLATGKQYQARQLLQRIPLEAPDYLVTKETTSEDFLNGRVDNDGIQAIFSHVDETRESILSKQNQLLSTLEKFPKFRAGIFHLAITWMQLNRYGEALEILGRYHELHPDNPTVEYYLAALHTQRYNYKAAWKHFNQAVKLTTQRDHEPIALHSLKQSLKRYYPE